MTDSALLILMENTAVAVEELASVTLRVKFEVPAAVGFPLITPVDAASVKPAGSAPALRLQVNGVVPPEAVAVWL